MDYLNAEEITADDEIGRIINGQMVSEYCQKYMLMGEDRTSLPEHFLSFAERIKNFEVNNDDVWVASFPKTGTTWTQEMVWLIANNLDYERAKEDQYARFPFIEISAIIDDRKQSKIMQVPENEYVDSVEKCAKFQRPRFIKTHLPYSFLPDQIKNQSKTPKIVYVWRNPKDTCVSNYHQGMLLKNWRTDLESFAKVFLADKATFTPYWKHVFDYWERRHSPNILIIKYEDMKTNLPSVIRKVAKFLEKAINDEQVALLAKYLNFEEMKNNAAVNKVSFIDQLRKYNLAPKEGQFMRSGTVGRYKEELSPQTIKRFDVWIKGNIAGTSLEEEYDYNL